VSSLEDENAALRERIELLEALERDFERRRAEAEARPVRAPKSADGGEGAWPFPWPQDFRSDSERLNDELHEAIAEKRHRRVWGGLWNDRPSLRPTEPEES
jgi:hypothetical protein